VSCLAGPPVLIDSRVACVLTDAADGEVRPLSGSTGDAAGVSSFEAKMLAIPLEITPGCIPRNGTSKLIAPRIRWRKT
jgi:hypothetical protein